MRLLSDRFERALLYAHELHGDQYRKGTPVPYMAHLMGVASLVTAFRQAGAHPIVDDLDRAVSQLEEVVALIR